MKRYSFKISSKLILIILLLTSRVTFALDYPAIEKIVDADKIKVMHVFPEIKTNNKEVIIHGDQSNNEFSIKNAKLEKPVKITSSIIKNFYSKNSDFKSLVYINDSIISEKFNIHLSNFDSSIDIKHNVINNDLSFYQANFNDIINLSFSRVSGTSSLSSNNFKDKIISLNTSYLGNANFFNNNFYHDVNFSYSFFQDKAYYINDKFYSDLFFDGVVFSSELSFHNSTFYKNASFNKALFPQKVDFSGIIIKNKNIDLNTAKPNVPGNKIYLNLLNTDVNKIDFNYINYRLFFPKETSHQEKVFLYTLLLNKFDKKGMTTSYETLFREYREYILLHDNHYILNFIDKNWWDYGLHKNIIYFWFLWLFIIITLTNCFFYEALITKYFNITFLTMHKKEEICTINPIINFIYNIPRAALLTLFFIFATFLQVLTNEDRIFKSDVFVINSYAILLNCIGYIFLLFVFESILNQI